MVVLFVIEPPELAGLHADLFVATDHDASGGTLQDEMVAVAHKVIRPHVDVWGDARLRLKPDDRRPGKLCHVLFGELLQKRHRSRERLRDPGQHGLLILVDVQIWPVYGNPQKDRIGVALNADRLLATGVEQPRVSVCSDLFKQRGDINFGADSAKVDQQISPLPARKGFGQAVLVARRSSGRG